MHLQGHPIGNGIFATIAARKRRTADDRGEQHRGGASVPGAARTSPSSRRRRQRNDGIGRYDCSARMPGAMRIGDEHHARAAGAAGEQSKEDAEAGTSSRSPEMEGERRKDAPQRHIAEQRQAEQQDHAASGEPSIEASRRRPPAAPATTKTRSAFLRSMWRKNAATRPAIGEERGHADDRHDRFRPDGWDERQRHQKPRSVACEPADDRGRETDGSAERDVWR